MAKIQIKSNNLLIDMEDAFGEESQMHTGPTSRYPQQVFNKLHDEVILFEESVKSIMNEIEPIKTIIIDKISNISGKNCFGPTMELCGVKCCKHLMSI